MTYSKLGVDTKTGELVNLFKLSRLLGLYIIGLQGMGKSGLLEELIVQDIKQEIGVCVLDPHGELIDHVIARLPDDKLGKVILLDLAHNQHPFGLNLFECAAPTDDGEIIQVLYQVLHVFEKAYGIVPTTPLMYDLLYNTVYTLIANPGYSMIDIRLLLTNEACRRMLVHNVPNTDIQDFWAIWDDPKQTSPEKREEKRASILNKMNDFLHSPLRNIIGQSQSTIHLQTIMDEGSILLVKLSRRLEQPSNLIGSILIAQLLNAAYARPPQKRKQFHLYADEFQNFATEDFATLLEEARKFGIGTTIAHQNRGQLNSTNSLLETNLKDRSRSVGNLVVFKINSKDATDLAGEFNITPQPAWEEEIEKEWVEVLAEEWEEEIEKEWHERIEEIVDDGDEAIRAPIQNVIQHLLEKGHPNPAVRTFTDQYLILRKQNPGWLSNKWWGLASNDFLAEIFTKANNSANTPTQSRFQHILRGNNSPNIPIPPELWEQIESYYLGVTNGFHLFNLADYVYISGFPNPTYRYWMSYTQWQQSWKDHPMQWAYPTLKNLRTRLQTSPDGRANITESEWAKVSNEVQQMILDLQKEAKLKPGNILDSFNTVDKLYFSHYKHYEDNFTKAAQEFRAKLEKLQAFLVSFRAALNALAADPILVATGQYKPRKRTQVHYLTHPRKTITHPRQTINHPRKTIMHPQRTYADMQAEMASELVNLPQYTARVKLSDGSGRTVEHTIHTFKPEKGLYGQALEARIENIRQQNIRDGYLKDRVAVEAEIRGRQAQGSQQGFLPPQSPPASRKAKPCSQCGYSNQHDASFCNKCGEKL